MEPNFETVSVSPWYKNIKLRYLLLAVVISIIVIIGIVYIINKSPSVEISGSIENENTDTTETFTDQETSSSPDLPGSIDASVVENENLEQFIESTDEFTQVSPSEYFSQITGEIGQWAIGENGTLLTLSNSLLANYRDNNSQSFRFINMTKVRAQTSDKSLVSMYRSNKLTEVHAMNLETGEKYALFKANDYKKYTGLNITHVSYSGSQETLVMFLSEDGHVPEGSNTFYLAFNLRDQTLTEIVALEKTVSDVSSPLISPDGNTLFYYYNILDRKAIKYVFYSLVDQAEIDTGTLDTQDIYSQISSFSWAPSYIEDSGVYVVWHNRKYQDEIPEFSITIKELNPGTKIKDHFTVPVSHEVGFWKFPMYVSKDSLLITYDRFCPFYDHNECEYSFKQVLAHISIPDGETREIKFSHNSLPHIYSPENNSLYFVGTNELNRNSFLLRVSLDDFSDEDIVSGDTGSFGLAGWGRNYNEILFFRIFHKDASLINIYDLEARQESTLLKYTRGAYAFF